MDPSSPLSAIVPLPPPPPSTRATQACQNCRKRKARCINFVKGACQLCREKGTVCEMAPNLAKDRAAASRARNEENEIIRQQIGPEGVQAILRGTSLDSDVVLLNVGRVGGRMGGSGPAGSLEDLKRMHFETENNVEFIPNATDSALLDFLSTSPPPHDISTPWSWTSGTIPSSGAFNSEAYSLHGLPSREECESLIYFYFDRLHPLMPMLSETRFWESFTSLVLDEGGRSWEHLVPWLGSRPKSSDKSSAGQLLFLPVLFGVLACASSARDVEHGDGERFHTFATFGLAKLSRDSSDAQETSLQSCALLSNHLASQGHLVGAWEMLKIGTTLVKERQLHLNASHGEGELAEFARRTVWCLIILDRNLSRLLAEPLQVIMPLYGSVALPVGADEGSLDWQQYFGHQVPLASFTQTPKVTGFILLCKLSELAARVIKDLYPPFRDRSQDWRFPGMRGLLESAVEVWDLELGEIEEDIWQAFGDLGVHEELDEASEGLAGLKEVVRNAVSDVRLLVYRVQLPRSSPRSVQVANNFSLDPQIAIARDVASVPTETRLLVPLSIHSLMETATLFLAVFPFMYAKREDKEGLMYAEVDQDAQTITATLYQLSTVWHQAEPFANAASDVTQLVVVPQQRKSTTRSKSKAKGKQLARLSLLPKRITVKATLRSPESDSSASPTLSPVDVDDSCGSPEEEYRLVSPDRRGRFQPYPLIPPNESSAYPTRSKHRPTQDGPRPKTARRMSFNTHRSSQLPPAFPSSFPPQPWTSKPPRHPHRPNSSNSYFPLGPPFVEMSTPLSDHSFSSPKDPQTPNETESLATWTGQTTASQLTSRREDHPLGNDHRQSELMSLQESPQLLIQPLGYDSYEMEEAEEGTNQVPLNGYVPTYSSTSYPLDAFDPTTNPLDKYSPHMLSTFPVYEGRPVSYVAPQQLNSWRPYDQHAPTHYDRHALASMTGIPRSRSRSIHRTPLFPSSEDLSAPQPSYAMDYDAQARRHASSLLVPYNAYSHPHPSMLSHSSHPNQRQR